MSDWTIWLIGTGILVIAELFTGTFYLLMIALGLCAGALAALLGASGPLQTLAAAAVGVAATLVLRRSRFGRAARGEAANDPNMNLDIGQRVSVPQWQGRRARVMYRGALWDVELRPGASDHPGDFRIVEVHGNRLVVAEA
ncbi:NfeD family protein [Massilia sp. ST3]|uniref:NfeD family protein n=1 Tax=Massilia sp. ST3 TaxID=2824903 RepID=UPI001B81E1A5|nr:NfeD family protein [Massilia sp. ST3]MBQ5946769.1 NfeD family protein [Massilia sp. ST3]